MDVKKVPDRGESVSMMTPLLIDRNARHRGELTDLAIELATHSSALTHSLPDALLLGISDLVRAMNCYYTNLIEGHNTHPIDIERSLENDYSNDPKKRDLQLEAKAHVAVQQWIDQGGLQGRATTQKGICDIHRRFSTLLPDALLRVKSIDADDDGVIMTPGELRQQDICVGRHVAISPAVIPQFLQKFEETYTPLGKSEAIIASAAAHHRLLWIHPFLDGNGRVTRLMSHAMLLELLDTHGIWSIARGLARNENAYKTHLANCDLQRRNDLDGRGNLSEEALVAFTKFFLDTCLDQVKFMEDLIRPAKLRNRVLLWAEEEIRLGALPAKASHMLEAILYRGEVPRAEVSGILGVSDRQSRRIISALVDSNVIVSDAIRSPFRLAFPATLAFRWLPGLFPER